MKKIIAITSLLFVCNTLFAQQTKPAFYDDIRAFKMQDSIGFPPINAILFVGSSSFTNWTDVQEYFPQYKIINRGFGGSTLVDVIRYADDIIIPYHAKQIVIYCGENDFAASDTVTIKTVVDRFKQLFSFIRQHYKNVPIAYLSMKPSPSRQQLMHKFLYANRAIKSFLQTKRKTAFIDVYHAMLDAGGKPIKDIFIEDNLHMNAKGYTIWQKIIAPYLVK